MADDQQNDTSWLGWGLALAGVATAAGVALVAYKGATTVLPLVLAYEAPDLLDQYEALRKASPADRRAMALKLAKSYGDRARTPPDERPTLVQPKAFREWHSPEAAVPPTAPVTEALPTIEKWRWDRDLPEIHGFVYGKAGIRDGESITVTPIRVADGIAETKRSRYRLGSPVSPGQVLSYEAPDDSRARM